MSVTEAGVMMKNLSILIVEDEDEVRESMARYLARRIDTVRTAHSGEAGLDAYRKFCPDLVISDISMGEMDGLAMCRAIRDIDPDFPVIILSAHNEAEMLLSSIDLGITKFLVKPVDTDVLLTVLGNVAESLEKQRGVLARLQQVDNILDEVDYETKCVRSYVSRLLESNHGDELTKLRYLNIPQGGVSGDFYCVSRNNDELYVMLADGAGHGLSAVLPALQIPRLFERQALRGFSLLTIAAEINRSLHEQNLAEHFVASTLLRINPCEGFIEVLNCGNPPVLIFGEDGELLHDCYSDSTALGMVGDDEFCVEVERFTMSQNARIYLFTDGLVDSMYANEPGFKEDGLHDLFRNTPVSCVFDNVSRKVSEAARLCKVDDVTLLEICFTCDFSAETDISADSQRKVEPESMVSVGQTSLLYVEDDDVSREYMAHYLSRRMGMVYVANNGVEGLALFKKHRPKIVLTDISMPQMDGLELAAEIRKLDKDVPIVMISGSDNAEDAERMFELGVSRFHMKPLDSDKLNDTIQACVRHANALDQLRLSASAFQTSSLSVITTDKNKHIVAANPAFLRRTGYTQGEVLGHSPAMLSAGKYQASHYQVMWQVLDESGSWSGELQCQHKSGVLLSEWLTVNAAIGKDGILTGYHFIFSDSSEREMNEEKFLQLSMHDGLTQLPNRAMFADRSQDLLASGRNLALVCINIDCFTEINKVHGVSVGDKVLQAFAQMMLNCVGIQDVVCRLGGDEFGILMLDHVGLESITAAVSGLARTISQPIAVNGLEIRLQASIGISLYPSDGETYEDLVKSSYSAMNQAQLAGGNTTRLFDKSISQREERRANLRQDIHSGLQKNQFYMLYQPKYSLSQCRVVGAEALVRWSHPEMGLISPVEFIPLAETSGAIIEMSEWIIDTVCSQLAKWRDQEFPLVPVSINISPVHFWRGDLLGDLRAGVDKWNISPEMLPVEVTEGIVMDDSEHTMKVLRKLQTMGFYLSIDDFGTGYSSLRYLRELPVRELKIDRSFVVDIHEAGQPDDLSRTAIVRTIIQLAAELNLSVVAEGVETEHQRDFLVANGCDVIQGYLFSRPVSADKFASLLC